MASRTSNASVCSAVALVLALAVPATARAEDATTEACLAAHTDGQRAQKDGRLLEAKERFLSCAAASCPDIVKQQCVPWLADVKDKIPSVVFDVRDARGADLTRVRVSVDGKVLTEQLDGRSIPLDPGNRRFTFESDGFVQVEQNFLLREGERSRRLSVRLDPIRTETRTIETGDATSSAWPWTVWVLGGAGIVALGAGGYFFFDGRSDVSEMRDTCAPDCAESRVDSARAKVRAADVLLGVGVVAVAAAAWIAIAHDSPPESRKARAARAPRVAWPSF